MTQVNFKANTFNQNYPGTEKSVVQIEGFQIVIFDADQITNNENYFINAYIAYSPIHLMQTTASTGLSSIS